MIIALCKKGLISLVVLVMLVTACSPKSPAATGTVPAANTQVTQPVIVTLYHNWNMDDAKGPVIKGIIDAFNAANPDIQIQASIFNGADIPGKVETEFAAGMEPDMVWSDLQTPCNGWIDEGLTIQLDDLIDQFGLTGKLTDSALYDWKDIKGRQMAFPLEGFIWPMWYNTKIFQEAGVQIPTTTAQLREIAPKIKALGYDVISGGGAGDPGMINWDMYWQAAMTTADYTQWIQTGNLASYPAAVKGMNDFFASKAAGVFPSTAAGETEDVVNTRFYNGKAAMLAGGSWFFGDSGLPADLVPNIKLGGFPIPDGSSFTKPIVLSSTHAKGIFITRNGAKKLDAIGKFLDFLYLPENMGKFVEAAGMIPPIKGAVYDVNKISPLTKQALDMLDNSTVDILADPSPFQPAGVNLTQAQSKAWEDGSTAQEVIALVDQAYTDILK
jgi:multiple sugar transport system substrate-binding protein